MHTSHHIHRDIARDVQGRRIAAAAVATPAPAPARRTRARDLMAALRVPVRRAGAAQPGA